MGEYNSGNAKSSVYQDQLYVLWNDGYPEHGLIRSLNGTHWSSVCRLPDMSADGAFVYAGKFWIYGTRCTNGGYSSVLRGYEKQYPAVQQDVASLPAGSTLTFDAVVKITSSNNVDSLYQNFHATAKIKFPSLLS